MTRRLFTPAIVLGSFAATFAVLSWHAGLFQGAGPTVPIVAPPVPVAVSPPPAQQIVAQTVANVTPVTDAAPAPEMPAAAPVAEPPPEEAPDVQPGPTAQETDAFLADQDRAARHSARSH